MNHCVVVGRGINYGNAFEFSLKLMETCYVIAERFSAADFVHGPIALIEHDFPAFVFMPPGKTFNNMRELTARLRKLHAEVVAIHGAKQRIFRPQRGSSAFPAKCPKSTRPFLTSSPARFSRRCWRKSKDSIPINPAHCIS